jgi:hypothetical protein
MDEVGNFTEPAQQVLLGQSDEYGMPFGTLPVPLTMQQAIDRLRLV